MSAVFVKTGMRLRNGYRSIFWSEVIRQIQSVKFASERRLKAGMLASQIVTSHLNAGELSFDVETFDDYTTSSQVNRS